MYFNISICVCMCRIKMGMEWWWHRPLIPAHGRQRQADLWEFEATQIYSEFQDSQSYTRETLSQGK